MNLFSKQDVHEFSDLASRGRGFVVGGKRTVHHTALAVDDSAAISITHQQKRFAVAAVLVVAVLLVLNFHLIVFTAVIILTTFYFLDLLFGLFLAYRSFSQNPEISVSKKELAALDEAALPTYTIFCPLYKEWEVLPQFVKAIQSLDYPKDKLQVMLQLEEDDAETVAHARAMQLPEYFEIVVVPDAKPKTKPKAMNYGLQFATGDIITIYDAEDAPEKTQLKKVVVAFAKSPKEVVCVQGKLNFYNPYQNLLTRMFTAEYSLWFDLILPGLQSINAPIPLGGTTNNFKREILQELAGWDAYNVTEDCDLGMRLAKKGYRTAIVDSTTLEEANSGYHNWYRQRSRWIKGYMQTYLVNMRHVPTAIREFGWRNFLLMQLTVGGKVLSMFVNPFLWLITFAYFAARTQVAPYIEPFFPPAVLYVGVVSLILGNFFYVYAYMIGLAKRKEFRVMKFVFLVPLYWLFMSVAAWKAFYELLVKPHYWQKTNHGLHLAPAKQDAAVAQAALQLKQSAVAAQKKPLRPAVTFVPPVIFTQTVLADPVSDAGILNRAVTYVQGYLKPGTVTREGAWLILGSMVANIFNFLFNALLGRMVSLAEFGTITFFNTALGVFAIVFTALSATVTHKVAFLSGESKRLAASGFTRKVLRTVFSLSLLASIVWVLFDDSIGRFFNIDNLILVWLFSPVLIFGVLAATLTGYLKGRFAFRALGVIGMVESCTKLSFALLFVFAGRSDLVAMSIPASVAVSYLVTDWYFAKYDVESAVENTTEASVRFPTKFFGASMLAVAASVLFLNVDVLMAKHYLNAGEAGEYALLSLVGKMIFMFGALLTTFINSVVSHHEGAKTNPSKVFSHIFRWSALVSLSAYVGVGPLGFLTIPLLFGDKAQAIIPYANIYGLGMVGFTLSTALVTYRVAKKEYSYAWIQLFTAVALVVTLTVVHTTIGDLANAVCLFGVGGFFLLVLWRAFRQHGRFVFRNLTDFFDLFSPLPQTKKMTSGKRILVLNWRDTSHKFSGGAETYIHELAKRWVSAGHAVTQFSGNDGSQSREELLDGVQMIRRGGFYFVYVWAFFYYTFRFRGTFDLIIDCQNGIPFFSPLYAREPVYCLLHHVHQEVFHKYLPKPLAHFAAFLEARVMPYVYKDTKFITVSNSSHQEMADLGLGLAGTEVVYPGVDLSLLRPGQQSITPLVLYLGRLKAYKSVDVLIRSFEKVLLEVPNARLVIAGGGEDEFRLRAVSEKLGLGEQVEFLGKVSDVEKLALLQQAWVFVNPSMMEGWGITTIEANACGVPVVASDVPGLRESVRADKTGLLVAHGDVAELATAISTLLSQNKTRERMAKNALAWANEFDWDASASKSGRVLGLDSF